VIDKMGNMDERRECEHSGLRKKMTWEAMEGALYKGAMAMAKRALSGAREYQKGVSGHNERATCRDSCEAICQWTDVGEEERN
jgi:hypothetical protein